MEARHFSDVRVHFDELMRKIADNITDEVSVDSNDDLDEAIREQLDYEIERACTYYSDCLNIILWSHMFDWSDADYNMTTIEQVAAYAIKTEFYENYYDAVYAFLEKEG